MVVVMLAVVVVVLCVLWKSVWWGEVMWCRRRGIPNDVKLVRIWTFTEWNGEPLKSSKQTTDMI